MVPWDSVHTDMPCAFSKSIRKARRVRGHGLLAHSVVANMIRDKGP